jgi:hypothetical protein
MAVRFTEFITPVIYHSVFLKQKSNNIIWYVYLTYPIAQNSLANSNYTISFLGANLAIKKLNVLVICDAKEN